MICCRGILRAASLIIDDDIESFIELLALHNCPPSTRDTRHSIKMLAQRAAQQSLRRRKLPALDLHHTTPSSAASYS